MNRGPEERYRFDGFELDVARRLLSRDGRAVSIGPKPLDLLIALVENRGRILSKTELLDTVWQNQFVEENNLTVHIAALRKALGETRNDHRFIVTVPGKGYEFVAHVEDSLNGDLVVEHHKIERIVIEEFQEDSSAADQRRGLAGAASRWLLPRGVAIAALAGAIAMLGVGGLVSGERVRRSLWAAPVFVEHELRQLTTNGKVGAAALSPDGKLFAYTLDDLGRKSLWLGYVDGGNHVQLRAEAEAAFGAIAFSPDSSHLYYSIRDEKNPQFALYKIPSFGGAAEKVMEGVEDFSLSPDGKNVAVPRRGIDGSDDVLAVAALDGSGRHDVVSFPVRQSMNFGSVSWSPDSSRLALSVVRDGPAELDELAVIGVADGTVIRIPLENWRSVTKTTWLADMSGLIVTALDKDSYASVPQYRLVNVGLPGGETHRITNDRSNYGASWHNDAGVSLSLSADSSLLLGVEHRQMSNVWIAPADNLSQARQITFSSFGKYDGLWGLDWTPDGRLIYTTSDTESQFLASMKGDGSDQKPISVAGNIDSVLTVSNDGRYVLFHSNRGSNFDIWRADADGSDAVQLTFGGKAYQPAPSPDGRWVYYKSWLNGIGELRRVPIAGGESEAVTDKETSWVSFSPDGKYFAGTRITDRRRLAVFSAETNELLKEFEMPKSGTLVMGSRWTPDSLGVMYRDNDYGYWVQPIAGGEPARLNGLPNERLYNFSWSRDGKWLAFVRGQEIRDVVLLKQSK
jgi:DNA-binding winged helix-turn-helix (wHTH) protein/Tol biopolymer transport system component